nr:lipocalin-like domain-containing protein [Vibrio sinensis]
MDYRVKMRKLLIVILLGLILASVLIGLYLFYKQPIEQANDGSDTSIFTSQNPQVFEPVLPDSPVQLPKDFQFHNDYQHEWWHFFANVVDAEGQQYGIQWSYFRIASDEQDRRGWQNPQLYVSHIVISNQNKVWKEQRLARGGIGQAGMTHRPFKVWIDNWTWRSLSDTPFPGQLDAQSDTFKLQLRVATSGPFVLPGDRGYVNKHDLLPIASHNVTSPFLRVEGLLTFGEDSSLRIIGDAWMSKEWGTGLMTEGQQGWDWFVLKLDNETTLSVNQYRHKDQLPYIFGLLATNDGKVVNLTQDDVIMTPIQFWPMANNKQIPVTWRVKLADHGIDVTTQVMNKNLWLPFVIPYWEGPIETIGTHNAKGFMQLTGY